MVILNPGEGVRDTRKGIVTVGNFDGVHRGHRYLLDEVTTRARSGGMASAVVTFEPHTRSVLNPETTFELLTVFSEKVHLMEQVGIDYLVKIPFSNAVSKQSPEEFIATVLAGQLHAEVWVMGEGHGIGKGRSGSNKILHKLLSKYHIIPFTTDLLKQKQTTVSSTEIREMIAVGRIADAVEMLGHPYLISSVRIEGLKIGSQLGFPTLNFARPPSQKVLPPPGVYTAELEYMGQRQPGALYFGDCPTFTDRTTHFEFHSLDKNVTFPETGEEVRLWLHTFLRHDRTFTSREELAAQINNDVKTIRIFFRGEGHAINQGT